MKNDRWIDPDLLKYLKSQFKLNWFGFHGGGHWARVRYNAKILAKKYECAGMAVDRDVLNLFSILHDHKRYNEGEDIFHGRRAADELINLRGKFFQLPETAFSELYRACSLHSDGYIDDKSLNVKICWDADRLDLLRVGIKPDPFYLCTGLAKEPDVLAGANQRAMRAFKNQNIKKLLMT